MSEPRFKLSTPGILAGVAAMAAVVVLSNYAVQFPVFIEGYRTEDWLTWGAFTYPIAFLVTDLTNRTLGPKAARLVIAAGFVLAVVLSLFVDPRIAIASGSAFLTAQLLDVSIFNRLRRARWWKAPLVSSTLSSIVDTLLFFSIAFAGTGLPWHQWALGDFGAKMAMAAVMLIPFRLLMAKLRPQIDERKLPSVAG
ncbi:MAG: queuosine precursor transporter [Kiloniellaceae bacterium]